MEDALSELIHYSLARWDGAEAVRVHRLVQEVTRGRQLGDRQGFWLAQTLRWVDDHLPDKPPPDDTRSWPRWEPLQAHAAALCAQADHYQIAEPTTRVMNDLGLFFWAKASYDEAEPLHRRALAIREAAYGPEHPEVAISLNNLAGLLQANNQLAEAEPLLQRSLRILKCFKQATGYPHPDWQLFHDNYAELLCAMGLDNDEIDVRLREIADDDSGNHHASEQVSPG